MQSNRKRIGFLLAFVTTLAALLLEPVNGPRRRARIRQALEPAARPIQAVRNRIGGKSAEQATALPAHPSLIDRLQHVAVRAQGQIDAIGEPPAPVDGNHADDSPPANSEHAGDSPQTHSERAGNSSPEPEAPRKRRAAKVAANGADAPAPRKRRKPASGA